MQQALNRLTRSRRDRVFGGICGGLASYLGWDVVLVRVAWVTLTVLSAGVGGVALYVLAWIIVPLERPDEHDQRMGANDRPFQDQPESANRPQRRLVRIHAGRKLAGVCNGLGAYFGVDPTMVRLLWIALILAFGAGILIYLLLWIVMPLSDRAPEDFTP